MLTILTVEPVPCAERCFCHQDQNLNENVLNCSFSQLTQLPSSTPNLTSWMVFLKTSITGVCNYYPYMDHLKGLDLRYNKISTICEQFANDLEDERKNSTNKHKLNKIWLGDNPYQCDCDMTWMITWLNNFTTIAGNNIIVDYQNLSCHSGMMTGKQIYLLDTVDMGCYSSKWTLGQKIGVGIGTFAAVVIIVVILLTTVLKREVKFMMYYHLNLENFIPHDDKNEKLNKLKYDAFFCFW